MPSPGADAWLSIDRDSGAVEYERTDRGWIAYLNDLHKGRDAGTAWKWVIDLSGAILTLVSVTGIGILLLLKKTRTQALSVMGLASVITIMLALRAMS